jgi:hypothetical protein
MYAARLPDDGVDLWLLLESASRLFAWLSKWCVCSCWVGRKCGTAPQTLLMIGTLGTPPAPAASPNASAAGLGRIRLQKCLPEAAVRHRHEHHRPRSGTHSEVTTPGLSPGPSSLLAGIPSRQALRDRRLARLASGHRVAMRRRFPPTSLDYICSAVHPTKGCATGGDCR